MDEQGKIKVEDAILMIADDLEGMRIPAGLTAKEAQGIIFTVSRAAENLRMCSQALRDVAAAKAAEKAEENNDDKADAE